MGSVMNIRIENWVSDQSITLEVKEAAISEKMIGTVKVIKLRVIRKSDKHSTRIGMFAYLRNNQDGYQTLGFPQVTLTFNRYAPDGKFVSRTFVEFNGVAVESILGRGQDEEVITFIAAEKSEEFVVPKYLIAP